MEETSVTEPTNEEIADVLERACDELIVRGWAQGVQSAEDGAVCIRGAICCAIHGEWFNPYGNDRGLRAWNAAEEALTPPGSRHGTGGNGQVFIPGWNDTPGRTEDDVHDLLRSTAKALREAE